MENDIQLVTEDLRTLVSTLRRHQESTLRRHQESTLRRHQESTLRRHQESTLRRHQESTLRRHQESTLRRHQESTLRRHQESTLRRHQESTLRRHQESTLRRHQESTLRRHQESTLRRHQESTLRRHQESTLRRHQESTLRRHQESTLRRHQESTLRRHQESTLILRLAFPNHPAIPPATDLRATERYEERKARAYSTIHNSISKEFHPYISDTRDGMVAWDARPGLRDPQAKLLSLCKDSATGTPRLAGPLGRGLVGLGRNPALWDALIAHFEPVSHTRICRLYDELSALRIKPELLRRAISGCQISNRLASSIKESSSE
uniref:Uncharacterized protein n=1 Tax=Strigamia maritima TaxID=126957 RepID=T1ITL2_STRMM